MVGLVVCRAHSDPGPAATKDDMKPCASAKLQVISGASKGGMKVGGVIPK